MRAPIGNWPRGCRVAESEKTKDKLGGRKIQQLNRLGFAWVPHDDAWQRGLEALKKFIDEHGHARVPRRRSEYAQVASFLSNNRLKYRKGKLSIERQKEIEALGVSWSPKKDLQEQHYRQR